MARCVHCGSSGLCKWVPPLDVIDTDPPCSDYQQTLAVKNGWWIFKALLGIEAGLLTLAILFALTAIQ